MMLLESGDCLFMHLVLLATRKRESSLLGFQLGFLSGPEEGQRSGQEALEQRLFLWHLASKAAAWQSSSLRAEARVRPPILRQKS